MEHVSSVRASLLCQVADSLMSRAIPSCDVPSVRQPSERVLYFNNSIRRFLFFRNGKD